MHQLLTKLYQRLPPRYQQSLLHLAVGDYMQVDQPQRVKREDAHALLKRFMPEMNAETLQYHQGHMSRYLSTVERLKDLPRSTRVLELGAPPHGMTLILRHFFFDHIELGAFLDEDLPGHEAPPVEPRVMRSQDGKAYEFAEQYFNCERDRWPYADGAFDLVMACELFEHLVLDPMHAISEANRVLRDNGRLLISVPNGVSMNKLLQISAGMQPNSFPFYRPMGVNARHNREPTPEDLRALFAAGGFEVEKLETVNYEQPQVESVVRLCLAGALCPSLEDRRECTIALARKVGPVRERYPTASRLYYSWDIERLKASA